MFPNGLEVVGLLLFAHQSTQPVQGTEPWWAMRNATEILTSFKNIPDITFIMRKGERYYNNTLSSLSWLARYQAVSMPQDLTLHIGAKKQWEIQETQEEQ